MLNIIHRLKSDMFPALFFLNSASMLAQFLIIPPEHRQEGMDMCGRAVSAQGYNIYRALLVYSCVLEGWNLIIVALSAEPVAGWPRYVN